MTIKGKISFYISIFFTLLFSFICALIINNFSNFRQQEFKERLNEKALSSIKLLVDVKEVDNHLLKIIDRNTINELYNEKTLIFDSEYNLIYSSLDDTKIQWAVNDLKYLKENNSFFRKESGNEVYGIFYDSHNEDYYVLVSANDSYGNRKLSYLIKLVVSLGVFFIAITWIITFYIVKEQLLPLNKFHKEIRAINDLNARTVLQNVKNSKNEINLLSIEFNSMINRIGETYQKQKEFTANVSHEFRTPLARISARIENQIQLNSPKESDFLKNLLKDITQLNELLNSLLILSKTESLSDSMEEKVRVDEVLYSSIERVSRDFNDFKVIFEIQDTENLENLLEVSCNASLLEIAFLNLLKNAYYYSDDKTAQVNICIESGRVNVNISNSGFQVSEEEQKRLFHPFMRGENAGLSQGLGLGLIIVKRILNLYGFDIHYLVLNNRNVFVVEL